MITDEQKKYKNLFLYAAKTALAAGVTRADIARALDVTPPTVSGLLDNTSRYPQYSLYPNIRRFHGVVQEEFPVELRKTGTNTVKPVHTPVDKLRKQMALFNLFSFE